MLVICHKIRSKVNGIVIVLFSQDKTMCCTNVNISFFQCLLITKILVAREPFNKVTFISANLISNIKLAKKIKINKF